jgi:nitroreductase
MQTNTEDQGHPRNEVFRVIGERRSVRTFLPDPVSDQDIQALLEAANKAPSAHNQQSWRFIVIRGEKKQGLVDLLHHRASGFPKASAVLLRMASRTIATAPVVIAIANTGDLIEHGTSLFQIDQESSLDFFRTMEIQSSSAAVQNMLLAATSLGLGTVWLGIMYLIKAEVLEFLGEPQGEFMAIVPVGYPSRVGSGPAKRSLEIMTKWME